MNRIAPHSLRLLPLLVALAALLFASAPAHAASGWRWPVEGELIGAYRNGDDPYAREQHRGIDIAAPLGTPVTAATDGVVTFAGVAGDSGVTVAIRTADGAHDTSYLHLAAAAARRGDRVSAGDAIGRVGTTGRRSAREPHLHFGVRAAGQRHEYRDPLSLLPPPAPPAERPAAPRPVPVAVPEPLSPGPALAAAEAAAGAPALAPSPALRPVPSLGPAAPVPGPRAATVPTLGPRAAAVSTPRRGPAAAPARVPGPGSARAPGRGPAAAPHALPAPAHAGSAAAEARAPQPSPAPSPATLGSAPRARQSAAAREPVANAAPPAPRRPRAGGGLDLGWLAACVGLVAAATLLGTPRGPLGSLRRARVLASASARPLRGRA